MTKKKSNPFGAVIIIVLLILVAYFAWSGFFKTEEPPAPPPVEQEEVQPESETDIQQNKPKDEKEQEIKLQKQQFVFEGKIDENSFEVESLSGEIYQLRIGNEKARQSVDVAEIGEKIEVSYYPNADSQLIAEKVVLLGETN